MGRRKDLLTEEVITKIIQASRKLFVTKGYFNTSIPDIVNESGISIGAIYHHFKNKQNLAKCLYDETMNVFITELNTVIAKEKNLHDKLAAMVRMIFLMTEDDPIVMEYMLFTKHTEIYDEAVPICMAKPFQLLQKLLEEGMNTGIIRKGRIEIVTASFIGIPLKVIELKLRGVITYPLVDVLDETIVNSWNAIAE